MKRIVLLSVVAVVVAFAPGSTAATHQVSITAAGFVPNALTVAVGDTVTWTNADTRNRRIVSAQAGFTSPVLTPTQTFSFTFTKAGRYRYEDSTVQPRQRGTITVRAGAATVSIAAAPKTVTFGRSTVLSGKVSSGRAGEKLTIAAKRCRDNAFKKVGDVTTTTDGAWSFTTKPLDHTTYRAQWGGATNDAAVRERPRISLAKIAAHKFRVRVFAAESFAGKAVAFQRWNATRRAWVRAR